MKNTLIYCLLLILPLMFSLRTQAQLYNGGFEIFNNDETGDGLWDDWYPHSIEYAEGSWHNSPVTQPGENSCDHIHTLSPIVSGTPRTGVGCARFGAVGNGYNEFFYGETDPLIAGQLYAVSFWIRKDYTTIDDAFVGAAIGESPAVITWTPFNTTQAPQVMVDNVGTIYQEVKFCFTAQNSVPYYITFGALLGYGGQSSILYFIDDVTFTPIGAGAPLPTANLTIPQTTYCTGDIIDVDGSLSQNETGYTWEVYELVLGSEQFVYSSGPQAGSAGTFNVDGVLGSVDPGECYRVYLKLDGLCPDETFVDFCFVDPNIDFVNTGDPVCEGTLVDLQVTGDNDWIFQWYEGSSATGSPFDGGLDDKTTQVTPTIGNSTYTVQVTTPEGCTFSKTVTLIVHSQNNIAPWMDGVNGSGEYTAYVQQGEAVYFFSNLYNDYAVELLTTLPNFGNLPPNSSHLYNDPNINGGIWDFSISTSLTTPPGEYSFTIHAQDNNACNSLGNDFIYTIIVICDQCPLCVYYEDRGPGSAGIDLPPETKAGQCIVAGFTEIVATGTANVLFQAGDYILEGPFFSAGPGYQAIIEPTTCVTDCEDCCADWGGFTYDEIPNPPIICTIDTDPTNDLWQVTDVYHPFCAYGATGFTLEIEDAIGANIYSQSSFGGCCSLESPAPENQIPNASIWWNGAYDYQNDGTPIYEINATYFYILTFYGCEGQTLVKSGFISVNPTFLHTPIYDTKPIEIYTLIGRGGLNEYIEEINNFLLGQQELSELISVYPNPASEILFINGTNDVTFTEVQMFDQLGNMLSLRGHLSENASIDIKELSSGTYYVKVYSAGIPVVKKFVKQ